MGVLSTLKAVIPWVAKNSVVVMDVADKVMKFKTEGKLEQLGEVVEELDKKIDSEVLLLRKELSIIKIILSVMSVFLIAAIIAIILLVV